MRSQRNSVCTAAVLLGFAACQDAPITGPPGERAGDPLFDRAGSSARAVTVYDQNLYIGTDLDQALAALTNADPSDDWPAMQEAVATLLATDYPSRAEAMADDIAKAKPLFIGLQEAWILTIDITGLPYVDQHYLEILLAALADRDLPYVVAASVTGAVANPVPGMSATNRDVLLVDPTRVTVTSTTAQTYAANAGEVVPGVVLTRGYVAVEAIVAGAAYTIASTHLEADQPGVPLPLLRAAQATELVTALGAADRVVLMGDLNDDPGSPMYQVVSGAGFTDVGQHAARKQGRAFLLSRRGSVEPVRRI